MDASSLPKVARVFVLGDRMAHRYFLAQQHHLGQYSPSSSAPSLQHSPKLSRKDSQGSNTPLFLCSAAPKFALCQPRLKVLTGPSVLIVRHLNTALG